MNKDLVNVRIDCTVIYGPYRNAKKTFFIQLYRGKDKIMRRLARQRAKEQIEKNQHPELGCIPESVDIEVIL